LKQYGQISPWFQHVLLGEFVIAGDLRYILEEPLKTRRNPRAATGWYVSSF
jgi:hypothetical protein